MTSGPDRGRRLAHQQRAYELQLIGGLKVSTAANGHAWVRGGAVVRLRERLWGRGGEEGIAVGR